MDEEKTNPDTQIDVTEFASVLRVETEEDTEAPTNEPDTEGAGEESIDRFGENWEDSDEERGESEERWFGLSVAGQHQIRVSRRRHSPFGISYEYFRRCANRELAEAGTT